MMIYDGLIHFRRGFAKALKGRQAFLGVPGCPRSVPVDSWRALRGPKSPADTEMNSLRRRGSVVWDP